MLAFQFLAAFLASWIFGFSLDDILYTQDYSDPEYVTAMKFLQILASLGSFVLPALLLSFLFAGSWTSLYNFDRPLSVTSLLLVFFIILSVIPLVNYLAELNQNMHFPLQGIDDLFRRLETQAETMMEAFAGTGTLSGLLVNILMIGVLAAVGEELIFRGLLQTLFIRIFRGPHFAIILTALLFSAFHFQFFSFIPRFVLGLVMGYLYHYGRSIWYPILAHFLNNVLGVVWYFFNPPGGGEDILEEIGTTGTMPFMALISLLLTLLTGYLWYRYLKHEKRREAGV